MWKRVFACAALLVLTACASSNPHTFTGSFQHPPANSRILAMAPDVQLAILNASGIEEPRRDWSEAARTNLTDGVREFVQAHGHQHSALDPNTAMEGRTGQIIRLHDVVGQAIISATVFPANLPTKKDVFDWTPGDGVQELAAAQSADYALFVEARGSYASAGRMIGVALGIGATFGSQQAFASLVDLHTGNIIWFNSVIAAPSQDMRSPEGTRALVAQLMDKAPL